MFWVSHKNKHCTINMAHHTSILHLKCPWAWKWACSDLTMSIMPLTVCKVGGCAIDIQWALDTYSGNFIWYRIVGNFFEHKFSRITNKHARKKYFAIFILATRSRCLTTPPTISCMEMVTHGVYFQRRNLTHTLVIVKQRGTELTGVVCRTLECNRRWSSMKRKMNE